LQAVRCHNPPRQHRHLAVSRGEIGFCTTARGIRVWNFFAPNRGLRGVPVGTAAKALVAKGLSPFLLASNPPAVKSPHLKRSRREMSPWDRAFTISNRFRRAASASARRIRDALLDRYMMDPVLIVMMAAPADFLKLGEAYALSPITKTAFTN
jgi:hypothetical protein